MQLITRKHKFDTSHRVMNEKMKCYRPHGHRYEVEMTFQFDDMLSIGYPIDFKEIKRIACSWIDDFWDHNALYNPKDTLLIEAHRSTHVEPWLMSLNGENEYCNPTVENIARELFLAIDLLFLTDNYIKLQEIKLYETENCFTVCAENSIPSDQKINFYSVRKDELLKYKKEKGQLNYDDRQ